MTAASAPLTSLRHYAYDSGRLFTERFAGELQLGGTSHRGAWRVIAFVVVLFAILAGSVTFSAAADEGAPAPLGTIVMRVDNGTSVTIWERTTTSGVYTFSVATLTGAGGTIDTLASEHYTITSDGTYLTIHCYRAAFGNGTGTGDNIAGVRLDGVPGHPSGIWASVIVTYIVGYGGIEASRFYALGPNLSDWTYMGDQESELVLAFTVETPDYPITIDTVPGSLQVTVDGFTATAPYTFWCSNGTSHTIGTASPQVAGDTRYVFRSWSDAGPLTHDVLCSGVNYTAYFSTQYRVIVDSQPAYLQIVVDGMTYNTTYLGWWNASEPHALGAPSPQPMGPDVRWVWESWSDGGLRSHAVSVTGPARFVAPFRTEVRVTVTTSPAGMRVTVDGTEMIAPGTFWWSIGTTHTVSAALDQQVSGASFRMESWSDGGGLTHEIVATRPGVYTAVYRQQEQVAPPVAMNWKPFLAAVFSLILLLVGIYRSWRRPYPFRGSKHRSLVTFLLFSGAFVGGEAATGILSLVTGVLAIPPLLGWGTAVDGTILVLGLVAILVPRGVQDVGPLPEEVPRPRDRGETI